MDSRRVVKGKVEQIIGKCVFKVGLAPRDVCIPESDFHRRSDSLGRGTFGSDGWEFGSTPEPCTRVEGTETIHIVQ